MSTLAGLANAIVPLPLGSLQYLSCQHLPTKQQKALQAAVEQR